jgi:hypothetical protein
MRRRRGVAINFVAQGTSMGDGDARMKASFATAFQGDSVTQLPHLFCARGAV